MKNIHRMRQLAGIQEVIQVDDPDEEDRRDDERRAREAKIMRLIAMAFRRIQLEIAEDGIAYDDSDREAIVKLDDTQISLDLLVALKTTGLAASYVIWATTEYYHKTAELSVMFNVDPSLDHAVLS